MKSKRSLAKRAAVVALCLCVAAPSPAWSQVDGFINLLGRVIEQDMRRQEHHQQRRYEENQRTQQQKRIRADEQARQNAVREREVALTKRLQTALGKLGFYRSKVDGDRGPGTRAAETAFISAFGIQQLSLTDADVEQVEHYASMGFRSRDEMQRASQGGFQSRQELLDAAAGGFASASEMAVARQAGFQTSTSYAEYQRSGFNNPDDFRTAERGGFTNPAEFVAAKAAGFGERDQYQQFLSSGLPDRATYEAQQHAAALAKAAGEACAKNDGDVVASLDTCLKAISAGARSADVVNTFETIGRRLQARRDELAAGTPEVEVANTDGAAPSAAAFLQEIALIDAAIKRQACGGDVLHSAWAEAELSCQHPDIAADEVVATLKAEAVEKGEAKRIAADAERDRLALEAARDRVGTLTENLTAFMEGKRILAKPLDVAKAFVALKQQKDAADFRPIEQALTRLEELLGTETDFQKFLEEKRLSEDVAKTNARATAESEVRRMEGFIEQYVARNLLDDRVAELLGLQAALSDARSSGQDVRVMNGQKEAKATLDRLGLSAALAGFVPAETGMTPSNIQQASNGLAVTDENKPLLEGDPKDILLLGNFGPKAPHLVLNLLGKPAFDGGTADYCWQGGTSSAADAEIRVVQALQSIGAEKFNAAPNCSADRLLSSDVIVLERGLFLQSDVIQASAIVEAFERQDLKLLERIAWADVGEEAQRNTETADTIKKDVLAGLRSGYGFVQSDNGAAGVCLVIKNDSLPLHQRLFAANRATLAKYVPNGQSTSTMSLERAFVGVQKQDCGLVYAEAADLKQLLQGMDTARIAYSILPIWVGADAIAVVQAALDDNQTTEQREIAARQQEQEGQEALAARQAADAETQRAKAQSEMRSRYAQEAKAAFNRLSDTGEAYIRSPENGGSFSELFPDIAQWKRERLQGGWQVDDYDGTLLDYGTAEWQGRRAEVVFVEMVAKSKNATLGKYAQDCFVVGYIIDDEFGRLRDPIATPCETSSEQVSTWRTGRDFESRWVAH